MWMKAILQPEGLQGRTQEGSVSPPVGGGGSAGGRPPPENFETGEAIWPHLASFHGTCLVLKRLENLLHLSNNHDMITNNIFFFKVAYTLPSIGLNWLSAVL